MSAGTQGFVPYCVPVQVPLKDVERELDRQLKATQGPGESPVMRARMSNHVNLELRH